jgi:hypothetical protein
MHTATVWTPKNVIDALADQTNDAVLSLKLGETPCADVCAVRTLFQAFDHVR